MKVQITTLKNNKLLREFANDKAFLGYVEYNNSKIKNIEVLDEEQLPELQKGVEIAKPSMSKGWGVLPKSAFGKITSSEKSNSVGFSDDKPIATEFRYEPTQPSEKAVKDDANDKVYLDGAKTKQPKVDQKPVEKEVKPEPKKEAEKEDKDSTVDTKEEKKEKVNESAGLFYQAIEAVKKDWNDVDKDEDKLFDICVDNAKLFGIDPNVLMKRVQKEEELEESKEIGTLDTKTVEDINSVNMDDFAKQYSKEYQFLYDNNDNVAGYREAVDAFEEDMKHPKFQEFVGKFITHRGDLLSSDREVAAFEFACEEFGLFDALLGECRKVTEGLFGFGAGSKENMEKALIIAYVKGLEKKTFFGMGLVTKKDLANFDEYKRKYDEYMGNNTETIEPERSRVTESLMKSYDHSYDDLIGKKIRIIDMAGEPDYAGKEGVVERIDSLGQLHGTWGGLAVQPENDSFKVIK